MDAGLPSSIFEKALTTAFSFPSMCPPKKSDMIFAVNSILVPICFANLDKIIGL